jgi:hypothetical protein
MGATLGKAIVAGGIAVGLAGCSILLDWGDYTGGDAGSGADGGDSGSVLMNLITCGTNERCAPAPPAGWTGPVTLYQGAPDAGVPSCGTGYQSAPVFQGNGGLVAAAASCTACTCTPGGMCSPPELTFYSDPMCSTPCGTPESLAEGVCVPASAGCTSFQIASPTFTGTACAQAGGSRSGASPSWSLTANACTTASPPVPGSCPSGQLCLPSPEASQIAGFCVEQSGEVACPASAYSVQHVYFHGASDTRDCSVCTCTTTSQPACSIAGGGFPYPDSTCEVPAAIPFVVPTRCAPTTTFDSAVAFEISDNMLAMQPATCMAAPGGGQPTGTVTTTSPTTFCCTP